jgi:hypothetical protein
VAAMKAGPGREEAGVTQRAADPSRSPWGARPGRNSRLSCHNSARPGRNNRLSYHHSARSGGDPGRGSCLVIIQPDQVGTVGCLVIIQLDHEEIQVEEVIFHHLARTGRDRRLSLRQSNRPGRAGSYHSSFSQTRQSMRLPFVIQPDQVGQEAFIRRSTSQNRYR